MASKNIKPIGDKLLIERLEAEEKTAGGIVIPDSAKEKPKQGKVIALGSGRKTSTGKSVDFQVKKGDTVVFTSYAGTDVKVNDKEYIIMSEDDILAIVD